MAKSNFAVFVDLENAGGKESMLTNIIEEKTELLYVGKGAQELVRMAFKKECGENSVVLPGVVSRKKQMVTPLLGAMEEEAGL